MDDEETRHRRLRLGELVEACFGGEQKALRQHIAARTKKEPNQGEISGLLKLDNSARSFGDKKAKNLTDQIGLHRRWFDMPLGANLRREQWLSESVIGRAAAEDVAHAADLLPSPNGESPEHPAQSPENNKGLVMQSNVVRLQREGAGLVEPAFERAAGHQQLAVRIGGHCFGKRGLRTLGSGTVGTAQQHRHLSRAAIGDAPGDIAQQAVMRVLRQQGEDVSVDAWLHAPHAPLLHAQRQQQQQPCKAEPAPPTLQAACRAVLIQSGGPRRHSNAPAHRSMR